MKKHTSRSVTIEELNRAFTDYEHIGADKDINAMTAAEFKDYIRATDRASRHYDEVLAALKSAGAVVKYDTCRGEHFAGKNEHRITMTVVSQGWVQVQAESESQALDHARKLAETDAIDLVETDVRFDIVSEEL